MMVIGIAANFGSILPSLQTSLSGDPDKAALALWHIWWPQFGFWKPDALAITAYSGAPFLSNHLGYMPIFQSMVFGLLAKTSGSPVLSLNLVLLASQIATHYMLHRFLEYKTRSTYIALFAATAVVLSPWYSGRISASDVISAGLWLLPAALLLWDAWLERQGVLQAGLLGGILYVATLSGIQNMAWILALWLPYAVWSLPQVRADPSFADDRKLFSARDQLALIGFAFVILLLIYPGPNIMRSLQGGEPAYASPTSPTPEHSLVGTLLRTAPIIWMLAAAKLTFSTVSRSSKPWLVLGSICIVFALDILPEPLQMVTGALRIPFLPLYGFESFFGPAIVALAVFGSLNWGAKRRTAIDKRMSWLAGTAALLVIITLSFAARQRDKTFQQVSASTAKFYSGISHEPEDYLLLNFPFGLSNVQDENSLGEHAHLAQYAAWHRKRTLSGVAHYYEPAVFDSFAAMTFLFPEFDDLQEMENAAQALASAVNTWRIGYVVVHSELVATDVVQSIDEMADLTGALCPGIRRHNLISYRAKWHPYGCPN